jgi:hypothetical protein
MSILLLVLVANPALMAIGQEETTTDVSEEVSIGEEVSMGEEEVTAEEEMTEEEPTDEAMADETMVMTTQIKSPKKQMNEGVEAGAVVCNEGLELIIKTSTGSAACIKSSSVETLIARGWGSTPA